MPTKLTSIFCVPAYTFFDWGINARTLDPKLSANDEYVKFFNLLEGKQSVEITLKIKGKNYPATVSLSKPRAGKSDNSGNWAAYHRVRFSWNSKHDTKKALRKLFIYSYVTTIDKGNPALKELAEFIHLGGSEFRVKAVGRQVTEFEDMFQFMEDKNLLDFWKDRNAKKNTSKMFLNNNINPIWRHVDDFDDFKKRTNVIYLLYHSHKNQIYVGKANKFGGRVTKGKKHQGIDEGWDWFMFFELHPDFVELYTLEHLEDFAIRLFTLILENNYKIKPLKKKPKLVNKASLKKK